MPERTSTLASLARGRLAVGGWTLAAATMTGRRGATIATGAPWPARALPPRPRGNTGRVPRTCVEHTLDTVTRQLPTSRRPETRMSKGRRQELQWIKAHGEELRKLVGQWIVVEGEGDQPIAHGRDPPQ